MQLWRRCIGVEHGDRGPVFPPSVMSDPARHFGETCFEQSRLAANVIPLIQCPS